MNYSQPEASDTNNALIGWSAALVSILIGVSWQLSTRAAAAAGTGSLSPSDLMLIRYCVPALILLPWALKWGLLPRAEWGLSKLRFAVLMGFGGLVYGVFSYTGARYAPVAHMGALVPGTIPIFMALLAWGWFKERPSVKAWAAFALLFAGVLLVSTGGQWVSGSANAWIGDILFLIAAFNWAIYTLAQRGVKLSAMHIVALVPLWNAPFALLIWWLSPDTRLLTAAPAVLAWQVPMQGVIAAIGGNFVFLVVLKRLGAMTAAGTGAAVPAGVALGGVLVLGEPLNAPMVLGVLLTVLGIWAVQVWARR
jgi:drug/metabolite transporter (DMT)-like permease